MIATPATRSEQSLLLWCISSQPLEARQKAIHRLLAQAPELDWERLLRLAAINRVSSLLYKSLSQLAPTVVPAPILSSTGTIPCGASSSRPNCCASFAPSRRRIFRYYRSKGGVRIDSQRAQPLGEPLGALAFVLGALTFGLGALFQFEEGFEPPPIWPV